MSDDDPLPALQPSRKRGGWSVVRQWRFLDHLRRFGGIAAAAPFAAEWDVAEAEGRDCAWEEAVRRGSEGYLTPVRYRGRIVGQCHRVDNRLLLRRAMAARCRR